MKLKISNGWFVYHPESDRFEVQCDILRGVNITPNAMKEISECANEILRAQGAMK